MTGEGREEISSPVGIVQGSSSALEQGFETYLWVLGLISLSLALLNLLPLLPLDGGHIAFSIIEGIRGGGRPRGLRARLGRRDRARSAALLHRPLERHRPAGRTASAAAPEEPTRPRMVERAQIRVGNVPIGGGAPVVVQSMTLTPTRDVEATTAQIAALASAGCEVVRCAVPKIEDAEALAPIVRLRRSP